MQPLYMGCGDQARVYTLYHPGLPLSLLRFLCFVTLLRWLFFFFFPDPCSPAAWNCQIFRASQVLVAKTALEITSFPCVLCPQVGIGLRHNFKETFSGRG